MPTDANFTVSTPVLLPGESFLVKYRLQPAVPFTTLSPNPITNSFTIPSLEDGCYDYSIQKVKSDGTVCPNTKTGTFCIGDTVCCTPNILSVSAEDLGASRRLTINYDPASCTPAPDSIRVYYRQKDSGNPYAMQDGFIASPIEIEDVMTEFEGYIVGLCGDTEAAVQVPFETGCLPVTIDSVVDNGDNTLSITLADSANYQVKVISSGVTAGSITKISSVTGSSRTEIFEIGATVQPGAIYRVTVYSHSVTYTAQIGDTAADVVNGLLAAVNATTTAEWNEFGSVPLPAVPGNPVGYPPTASNVGGFPNRLQIVLNNGNSFAEDIANWDFGGSNCSSSPAVWSGNIVAGDNITTTALPNGTYIVCVRRDCGGGNFSDYISSDLFNLDDSVPPVECTSCGKYQAIGENPSGTLFTWTDCEGGEGSTTITMGDPPFEFCTCDDDPQYSNIDVTVSRIGYCGFTEIVGGFGSSEGEACSSSQTIYIAPGHTIIEAGAEIYYDTPPLTTFGTGIVRDGGGTLWNVVGGVVTTPTGNSC